MPVERKSRNVSQRGPFEGEVLQLAAYCLLVEEKYQTPVQRGRLQYLSRSVDVAFDARLRRDLMSTLEPSTKHLACARATQPLQSGALSCLRISRPMRSILGLDFGPAS